MAFVWIFRSGPNNKWDIRQLDMPMTPTRGLLSSTGGQMPCSPLMGLSVGLITTVVSCYAMFAIPILSFVSSVFLALRLGGVVTEHFLQDTGLCPSAEAV